MILNEMINNTGTVIYCQEHPGKFDKNSYEKIKAEGMRTEKQKICHFRYSIGRFGINQKEEIAQLYMNAKNDNTTNDYFFYDEDTIDAILQNLDIKSHKDFDKAINRKITRYSGSIGMIGFSID